MYCPHGVTLDNEVSRVIIERGWGKNGQLYCPHSLELCNEVMWIIRVMRGVMVIRLARSSRSIRGIFGY